MAVTAYAGREDEDRIRAVGANAYVSKPISLARFMEEVRALVPGGGETEAADAGSGGQPESEA
jgi:two-component system cell cycle response regulator DivK